jgi:hypothetical protein
MSFGPTVTRNAARTAAGRPIAPSAINWRASWVCGCVRHMKPSAQTRPCASAASKQRSASLADQANGFSHSTCFPASSAATVHSVCSETGSGT